MKSLSQHFDKETYQYANITWLLLTGNHLCWSLFLILSIAKFLRAIILKNICEQLLVKLCSWNWENLFIMGFNFTFKYRFFQHQYQNQVHFGISWLVCIYTQYFFGVVRNKLQTKEDLKFKKRNCQSCERALNFDQWKTFSENHKPMRVWLCLVYKFTENYCRLRLFSEFIQTQKRYPYLSWQNTSPNSKTTCHIKLKLFLWTKLLENLLLAKYLISVAAPNGGVINTFHITC